MERETLDKFCFDVTVVKRRVWEVLREQGILGTWTKVLARCFEAIERFAVGIIGNIDVELQIVEVNRLKTSSEGTQRTLKGATYVRA